MLSSEEYGYDVVVSEAVRTASGVISLVSLISNMLLLRVMWQINEVWGSFAFRLITCVAVADILSSLAALGMTSLHGVVGYPGIVTSSWFCRVFGFSMFLSYNLSGILVSLIGLDRYLVVRHRRRLRPLYTWLAFGMIALMSTGMMGYTTYHNAFKFDPTFSYCVPRGSGSLKATEIFMGFLTNLPVVVLSFSYISIYLASINNEILGRRLPSRALLLFLVYLTCYFPKFFSTVWKLSTGTHPPSTVYYVTPIGLTLVLVFNPILVLFLSNKVHQETIRVFFCRPTTPKHISPQFSQI